MAGSASPRKPKVATPTRSAALAILLVAWRSSASTASSRPMPAPSSLTWISVLPPFSISTRTCRAPASMAFSTSSLTTDAGPLDHLAGGDLVGDGVGQDGDPAGHRDELNRRPGHGRVGDPAALVPRHPHQEPAPAAPKHPHRAPPARAARPTARGPWGDTRTAVRDRARSRPDGGTTCVGRVRRPPRSPTKTSSTSQRSRRRGSAAQPSQPASHPTMPSSRSSSGVTGGRPGPPRRDRVGRRREPERPAHRSAPRLTVAAPGATPPRRGPPVT